MADIRVRQVGENGGWTFEVEVAEGSSSTRHEVTLSRDSYQQLTDGKCDPPTCVQRSFEFLLEREPKESILRRFDLPLIGHYFPEYPRELRKRL